MRFLIVDESAAFRRTLSDMLRARQQYAQSAQVDTQVMKIRVIRTLRKPAEEVERF